MVDYSEIRSHSLEREEAHWRRAHAPGAGRESGREAEACPFSEWGVIWSTCRRQIQRWRLPPRWNRVDWLEEMQAEGAIAAVKAGMDYNPATRVPLPVFVARRVMGRAITRYRKEWSHAAPLRCDIDVDEVNGGTSAAEEPWASSEDVRRAVSVLQSADRELIERLFWNEETEAEVARSLGITQQAVSKRKLSVLRTLQRILGKRTK